MELSDDLLIAIHLADNALSTEGVPLGWGEGNFDEDVTSSVKKAWDEASRVGAKVWLERHSDKLDHPYVKNTSDRLDPSTET